MTDLKAILAGVFVPGAAKYSREKTARAKKVEYAVRMMVDRMIPPSHKKDPEFKMFESRLGDVRGKPLGERPPDDAPIIIDDKEGVAERP